MVQGKDLKRQRARAKPAEDMPMRRRRRKERRQRADQGVDKGEEERWEEKGAT
jgi:hypothetical protein